MKRFLLFSILVMLVAVPASATVGGTTTVSCGVKQATVGMPTMWQHHQEYRIDPNCSEAGITATPEVVESTLKEGILPPTSGDTKNVDCLITNETKVSSADGKLVLSDSYSTFYTHVSIADSLYEGINEIRAGKGLAPLVYMATVETDAQTHADSDILDESSISGSIGTTLQTPTCKAVPSANCPSGSCLVTPETCDNPMLLDVTISSSKSCEEAADIILAGWMNSPLTSAKILNSAYTRMGIGVKDNAVSDGKFHFAVSFASDETVSHSVVNTPVKIIAPITNTTPVPIAPVSNTSIVDAVVKTTNRERAAANLSPLKLDPALSAVAQGHSADMSTNGYFNHTAPDGSDLSDRLDAAGYEYSAAGENIARSTVYTLSSNFTTVGEYFVDLWMDSPGHRKNILTPEFTLIGIGVAWNNSTGYTLTQDFADKPDLVEATKVTPVPTQVPTVAPTPKPTPVPAPVLPAPALVVPDLQKIVNPTTPVPTTAVPTPTPTPVPTQVPTVAPTPAPATVFVPEPTFVTDFAPYTGEEGDAVVAGFWDSFVSDMFGWM